MSLIGKQVGNYLIKAKLGEGGMGTVYLGEHPGIGKRVAVKVLLEELASKEDIVTRFFNEAKAVNDIGHENIVDVIDFGKMKSDAGVDIVYFIMEYLDGESLAQRIRSAGLLFDETTHIIRQCCDGLAASHAKGVVHRDLKPENIYLCRRGQDKNFTKILDFGIAKLTGDGGTSSHKTRTGLVIGTPTYMSPEQCEGRGLIDSRSDVYSLGVVLYELLTGRVPFPGEGFGEILVAHLTKEPELPSTLNPAIPPELEAIVMHAIEKDRARRFQTMEEFGAALADAAGHMASYQVLPASTAAGSTNTAQTRVGPAATSTGSRPTTLSGAAAELGGSAPHRSRGMLFVGATAVVVAAVGITLLATGKKPPPNVVTSQVREPVVPVAAPKDAAVRLVLTSDPADVEVFRAGMSLGKTPITITAKNGEPSIAIELRKPGFITQQKVLDTSSSNNFSYALSAAPVATVSTTTPKRSTHGASGHAGKKPDRAGDDMSLLKPNF
ncbi:MAG: serine/threonine-protein kinase [Polyangia bacterium]